MRERPILFSAPMVRAILSGTKTQTRRIAKAPNDVYEVVPSLLVNRGDLFDFRRNLDNPVALHCPYGAPGDRLRVKETIRWSHTIGERDYAVFAADGALTTLETWPWQRNVLPSMFMPLGLSRITLEVTGVRVERLQAITDADADAEGATADEMHGRLDDVAICKAAKVLRCSYEDSRAWFGALWMQINGAESWDANPYVWVVEFRRVEAQERAA